MHFQNIIGDIINDFLKKNLNEEHICDKLYHKFIKSFNS